MLKSGIFLLFIIAVNSFSQINSNLSSAFLVGINAYGQNQIQPSLGIDAETRGNHFGIYFAGIYNVRSEGTSLFELTAGPRLYMGNPKRFSVTAETGLGFYFAGESKVKLGVNLGAGVNYKLSNTFDILLKSKYHLHGGSGYGTSYGTLHAGLRYYIDE